MKQISLYGQESLNYCTVNVPAGFGGTCGSISQLSKQKTLQNDILYNYYRGNNEKLARESIPSPFIVPLGLLDNVD